MNLRLSYSLIDNVFWLIDLDRETQTRLTESKLYDILKKSKCRGWKNLAEIKHHPNHLFIV